MPTGSGKSLCFQLPGLVLDGLTLVVSPLIALMRDQHDALLDQGHTAARLLNSSLSQDDVAEVLAAVLDGSCRLLYVAPERFADRRFRDVVRGREIALFAVDEAHCLSEWGHDFRPDYLRLADARDELGARCTMALTATATPRVAADISRVLRLRDPIEVVTGFDRPNLTFDVVEARTDAAKWSLLSAGLGDPAHRPAVVYAGTRDRCDRLAASLREAGLGAESYHAGVASGERDARQRRFMAGECDVVVATTAFGMGIDKADVRSVWHWALPASLEAYYQEAGRAGRDGAPARCVLLFAPADRGLIAHFITSSAVEADEVNGLLARLAADADERGDFQLSPEQLGERGRILLGVAERVGALELWPGRGGGAAGRLLLRQLGARRTADVARAGRHFLSRRWDALGAVTAYADERHCRRRAILRHFGDRSEPAPLVRCCDVCEPPGDLDVTGRPGRAGLREAILATVAEARPAVGRSSLDAILRGATRARPRYGALAGFGVASGMTQAETMAEIDAALHAHELESSGGRYPTLRLPGASRAAELEPAADDLPLAEALRAWRLTQAREQGVPAYAVLPDSAIEDLCALRPDDREALLEVRGIGPARADRYGVQLLELVQRQGRAAAGV
jgi:ATP-dependent DNA helicase RecQ